MFADWFSLRKICNYTCLAFNETRKKLLGVHYISQEALGPSELYPGSPVWLSSKLLPGRVVRSLKCDAEHIVVC